MDDNDISWDCPYIIVQNYKLTQITAEVERYET